MATTRPITDAELKRLREMHAAGASRNDIARDLGRSGSTISKMATREGLSFERAPEVSAATKARQVHNAARRATIVARLYDRAEEFLEQVDQPHVVFNFGGKDNTYEERTLDRPTTGDIRNLMQSASIALQRAADLERVDSDQSGLAAVDAWLRSMLGDTE